MAKATLVLGDASLTVASVSLVTNCSLFGNNLTLAASPYNVKSSVALEVFQLFLESVEGKDIQITKQNASDLSRLCTEFGFESLSRKLSAFLDSPDCGSADAEAKSRIRYLEERDLQQDRRIASLEAIVSQMQTDFARQTAEVQAALRQLRPSSAPARKPPAPQPAEQPAPDEQPLAAPDSLIVASLPPLLDEFRGKRFALLWRGSRDGFGAGDFHGRCDGRANTLTLILDTRGNVFGGFTPLAWQSPPSCLWKSDDSLKSFIFTLKNPHNIPARKFALKIATRRYAICCSSSYGPYFVDIGVSSDCNANTGSGTSLGGAYANDTGLHAEKVFTTSKYFRVKEIEVFEITDQTLF
jgi:uncharacterized coiled-coil protein SlyX